MQEVLTDEEYVCNCKNGDGSSIEHLINKYKPMVKSIARRYFLIGAEQEDLVQEGMIGLYKACMTFNAGKNTKFSTYAYMLINRQILSAIKMATKKSNLALSQALILTGDGFATTSDSVDEKRAVIYLPINSPSPESQMIEEEEYLLLIEKIKKALSKYEYEVLRLFLEGHKNLQISLLTGKDLKSTENAIARIKTKLRFLKSTNC